MSCGVGARAQARQLGSSLELEQSGRLADRGLRRRCGSTRGGGPRGSGGNAYDITYTYDGVGNRLTKVDSDATTAYAYDAANQLNTEEDSSGTITYTYDADGNLEVKDDAGSLTTYSWDVENRMVKVELSGGAVNTMTYAGDGKRRRMEDSEGTHDLVWDGENIALDLDASSTRAAYTHAPMGFGELISQRRSGASAFHHYDGLGSTDRLTDSAENTSISYLYKAFGEQSVLSGSHNNPFTWVGRLGYWRQKDPSDYWLRARIYDQLTGRFLSRDPVLQTAGGQVPNGNLYIWPGNSPVVLVDPSGMQGCRGRECRERRRSEPRRAGPPGRFQRPSRPSAPSAVAAAAGGGGGGGGFTGGGGGGGGEGGGEADGGDGSGGDGTNGEKPRYWYDFPPPRFFCKCPKSLFYCRMPTGYGPRMSGYTRSRNRYVKEVSLSSCWCDCTLSEGESRKDWTPTCGGHTHMSRLEWRDDTDELLWQHEMERDVRGRCVLRTQEDGGRGGRGDGDGRRGDGDGRRGDGDGRGDDGDGDECQPYITRADTRVSCVRACALKDTERVELRFLALDGGFHHQMVRLHKEHADRVASAFDAAMVNYLFGRTRTYRPINPAWPIWHWSWKFADGGEAPPRLSETECHRLSWHAHGLAIDVNAPANGRVRPNPNWQHPQWCPYALRDTDGLVRALESIGWDWGGYFSRADYMHFGAGEGGETPSGFTGAVCD